MAEYRYVQENGEYVIYEGMNVLKTPGGNPLATLYRPLAQRIVRDLNRFGYSSRDAGSILPWHFTMRDNFAHLDHEEAEQIVADSFLQHDDWTCEESHGYAWRKAFDDMDRRGEQMREWLGCATHMQIVAACCIGNAYESLNVAFALALIMERYSGEQREKEFARLAELIGDTGRFGDSATILEDFKTFELYYGIHLEEEGPILSDIVDDDWHLFMTDLEGETVTAEALAGRNFYYYSDLEADSDQPASCVLPDLSLSLSDADEEEDEEDEDDDDGDDDESDLGLYLPGDCWVKRYVDDDDPNTCYLLYLELDDDGSICNVGCISESTARFGGGLFFIPGLELPGSKSYDEEWYMPEKVMEDVKRLMEGRAMPLDFSFIGKRLPEEMIEEGGNGGGNTNYTFAIQSAYRMAYTHLSIDTTEDGVIEDFSYSSWQSSGSPYGDMFSRPVQLDDRREEAVDTLLYLFDRYSDEELARMGLRAETEDRGVTKSTETPVSFAQVEEESFRRPAVRNIPVELLADKAKKIMQSRGLLNQDGSMPIVSGINYPDPFAEQVKEYCDSHYGKIGDRKVKSEYIITSFYSAICAVLLYKKKELKDVDKDYLFYQLMSFVDMEREDAAAEHLLGTEYGQPFAEDIWSMVSSYVGVCFDVFESASPLGDDVILAAIRNAFTLGMLVGEKYSSGQYESVLKLFIEEDIYKIESPNDLEDRNCCGAVCVAGNLRIGDEGFVLKLITERAGDAIVKVIPIDAEEEQKLMQNSQYSEYHDPDNGFKLRKTPVYGKLINKGRWDSVLQCAFIDFDNHRLEQLKSALEGITHAGDGKGERKHKDDHQEKNEKVRYFIEEAKCGLTTGGIACGHVGSNVVTTVKYRCGAITNWLTLVEVQGVPNFLLSERDMHDALIEEDAEDKAFWNRVFEASIGRFYGIELGEYEDIFWSFQENPENPAIPLLRYLITLTRCPMEEVEGLIALGKGKFVDEIEIPLSEDEEEFLAEFEEDEE